jgi:hypothetical protein
MISPAVQTYPVSHSSHSFPVPYPDPKQNQSKKTRESNKKKQEEDHVLTPERRPIPRPTPLPGKRMPIVPMISPRLAFPPRQSRQPHFRCREANGDVALRAFLADLDLVIVDPAGGRDRVVGSSGGSFFFCVGVRTCGVTKANRLVELCVRDESARYATIRPRPQPSGTPSHPIPSHPIMMYRKKGSAYHDSSHPFHWSSQSSSGADRVRSSASGGEGRGCPSSSHAKNFLSIPILGLSPSPRQLLGYFPVHDYVWTWAQM